MGDLGSVAQAGASVADTEATNAANAAMQIQGERFNASQATLGRQFAAGQQSNAQAFARQMQLQAEAYNTGMSNTAERRRVNDLRAAGLNPALAIMGMGAASSPQMSGVSSPALGGPTASAPSFGGFRNTDISSVMSNIAGQALAGKQGALADAQKEKAAAEARLANAQAVESEGRGPYSGLRAGQELQNLIAERDRTIAQGQELWSQYNMNNANWSNLLQDHEFRDDWYPQALKLQELDRQLKAYGIPEASAKAQYWQNNALSVPVYAGQQGRLAGGDPGAVAATAAALHHMNYWGSTRRDAMGVNVATPGGFGTGRAELEASGIGDPSP